MRLFERVLNSPCQSTDHMGKCPCKAVVDDAICPITDS